MKPKLIKLDSNYFLKIGDTTFATSATPNLSASIRHSLSIKNCQAIERGYDLDELANEYYKEMSPSSDMVDVNVFKAGFQKALEILGDRRFTIEQVVELAKILISNPMSTSGKHPQELVDEYVRSLQQNEWEVEIEMDILNEYDQPKLDADGCLILKRVV
jgi:hypothetical protein